MKVSIVVPAYNSKQHIDKCLQSICNQHFRNLQIIVVNDGSTDDTLDRIKAHASLDPRIEIIDIKNSGTLLARKAGFNKANGDAILNVDADDYLEPTAVSKLASKMESTGADVVVGNHFVHENGSERLVKNSLPFNTDRVSVVKHLLTGKLTGYVWGKLYRADLLKTLRLPVEKAFTEDMLTNFYIATNHDLKLDLVENGIINYVVHDKNVSQSKVSGTVEGFFNEFELVERILEAGNVKHLVERELALYRSKSWVVYCRKDGNKSKDLNFHRAFFKQYYPLVKKDLPFYQRIEMLAYNRHLKIGRLTTKGMRLLYDLLGSKGVDILKS